MICLEVSVNGRTLCTAGAGQPNASMTAVMCALNWSSGGTDKLKLTLDVAGAADEIQLTWLEGFDQIGPGDTITVRVLERAEADAPKMHTDKRTLQMRREEAANPDESRCSWCHRPQSAHRKLIAGPSLFICTDCVDVCAGIIGAQKVGSS